MKHAFLILLALAVLLTQGPSLVRAEDKIGPVPGLPWVHEGTLVTSRWYTAKLVGPWDTFKQNDHGDWVGADGQHYDKVIHQGTDAGGVTQTSVVCIDGENMVLKTDTFKASMNAGAPDPMRDSLRHGGEIRAMVNVRDNPFCKSPDVLAHLVSDPEHGVIISNIPWREGNVTVDAVRIDTLTKKERMVIVFDRKTGLGLHLSSVSDIGDGESILMMYNFADLRDLQVPWGQEALPQAVRNMKSMRMSGGITLQQAFGIPPSSVAIDYSLTKLGDKWACFNSVGSLWTQRRPQPMSDKAEVGYYGSNEFGGLWIGPAAAARLTQGQVLDEDPVTKVKTFVSRIDDQGIEITQANSSTTVKNVYDRASGLQVGSEWYDRFTRSTTTMHRENVQ